MATSSFPPGKFRNRKPDNRYKEQVPDSYRLSDPQYCMAFATRIVQAGFKYELTPCMERVRPGREFRTRGKKTLWNRSGTITAAYKSLLSHFADHLLQPRGKVGHVDKDLAAKAKNNAYMWFLHPQVTGSNHNIHCTACHMPGSEGFSKHDFPEGNNPYLILHDEQKHTWYTRVNLGRDTNNQIVWESAHVILAAARWGVPIPQPAIGMKTRSHTPAKTLHALHGPCCPGSKGGCLNPLHMVWGTAKQNRKDQETKRARQNRGPNAWGRTPQYALVPD